jgi:hypothetical protein
MNTMWGRVCNRRVGVSVYETLKSEHYAYATVVDGRVKRLSATLTSKQVMTRMILG